MDRRTPLLRRPIVRVLTAAAGALVVVVGLVVFQPWKLWVDVTVDEAPPAAAAQAVLASGTLISHEHATTGTVSVVAAPDGTRYLRLTDLDTSNGPVLKVWLTDAPVLTGRDGWKVFDDGAYVDLGDLKGNRGSHNYLLPADVDLSRFTSVSIWCDRFDVSFGAAALTTA
jgi:hypothetical protein